MARRTVAHLGCSGQQAIEMARERHATLGDVVITGDRSKALLKALQQQLT